MSKEQELEAKFGVGNITKDNKVRGSVVMSGNQMLWYNEKQQTYYACVYHDDIREDLIRIAKAMYPDYDIAPAQGLDPLDVTSNCSALSQNTWSVSTAEDRANIYDTDRVSVMMLPERVDHYIYSLSRLDDSKTWEEVVCREERMEEQSPTVDQGQPGSSTERHVRPNPLAPRDGRMTRRTVNVQLWKEKMEREFALKPYRRKARLKKNPQLSATSGLIPSRLEMAE